MHKKKDLGTVAASKTAVSEPRDCNKINLGEDRQAIRVYKKPIVLSFKYAMEDQVIETKEGIVHCKCGDAILTGTERERWPLPLQRFEKTYDIIGDGQCAKKKIEVLARQMEEPFTVNVSWSKDALTGKKDDWLVQYGPGDLGVVSQQIFKDTYEIIPKK